MQVVRTSLLAAVLTASVASAVPLPGMAAPRITLIDSFTNGPNPNAALTPAGGAIFYGTTFNGGSSNMGGVFEFNSTTGAITLKGSFNVTNGANPNAALTPAGGGIFYGTTMDGGSSGQGGVFEFNSTTGAITLKGSFNGANGANPNAALTPAPAGGGIFYGTTSLGGSSNQGGVFEFNSTTGAITLKDSFNGTNGANPNAPLTPAGGGIFYGTATSGGSSNQGGVFEFNSSTGAITLIDSFNGANGSHPNAALTAAGGGIFYSTTLLGGSSSLGGVFEFNSTTGAITLKGSFNRTNGSGPWAALTAAGGGIFYGTTVDGGSSNLGGVFEFNSTTGAITLKASFNGTNGANPFAALTAAGGGIFYGTTVAGGANGGGGVFAFDAGTALTGTPDAGSPVPGPLPLIGAGTAFAWSRRLRRRLKPRRPLLANRG